MKHLVKYGVVLSFFMTLLACSSGSQRVSEQPVLNTQGSSETYKIGVGDELQINVWRNEELSVEVPVRPDGKISMPLIGDIDASGASTEELAANITSSLSQYIRNPQVTVIVRTPSSSDFQRRVRITGSVENPMSVPYREGMTVLDLVLLAGGANEFAAPNKAKLYRKSGAEVKVYPVNLEDILKKGDLETNYPLQASDIITVPERLF